MNPHPHSSRNYDEQNANTEERNIEIGKTRNSSFEDTILLESFENEEDNGNYAHSENTVPKTFETENEETSIKTPITSSRESSETHLKNFGSADSFERFKASTEKVNPAFSGTGTNVIVIPNAPTTPTNDEYSWPSTSPGGLSITFLHSRINSVVVSDGFSPSSSPSQESMIIQANEHEAVKEFMRLQHTNREDDLVIKGLPIASKDVPVVHPRLVKTSFFTGEAAPVTDEYNPSNEDLQTITYGEEISFETVLNMDNETKFVALIGFPGSGKTTCSKRLAKSDNYVCFHLYFMRMTYGDQLLTLQQLLLDYSFPDFDDPQKRALVFQWVRKNQEKVAIIIDGYDQAEWELNERAPPLSYDSPQRIENLVSSLCNRHYLPQARLVITSRPHSVISMPSRLRPPMTLFLRDLAFDDMKTLFYTFAQDQGNALWKKINTAAPQLISFCLNPMMLQFCIQASLRPSERVGEITTVTRIFATVIENIKRCDHVTIDIQQITRQLSKIAFDATKNCTVLITVTQLQSQELKVKEVQDLVIAVQGYLGMTSRVFEGDTKLYFSHQSLQEYFTAMHIVKELPFAEFYDVIDQQLFTPRWSMVRKFACGLLLDMKIDGIDVERKRSCFLQKFETVLDKYSREKNFDQLVDTWIDIRECNKEDLLDRASRLCPDVIDVSMTPITASQAHAISTVVRKINFELTRLDFYSCSMDDYSFNFVIDAIKDMPGSIRDFSLIGNNFSEVAVPYLNSILFKIKHQITMWDLFNPLRRDRNALPDEIRQLQAALNRLPPTELMIKTGPSRQITHE